MKFTVVLLFAALAVAAAAESEAPKDSALVRKITKFLSFNLPNLFAPIRTTPRPKPAAAKPKPKPPAAKPKPPPPPPPPASAPAAPAPAPVAPPAAAPSPSQDAPPKDPMQALNELYQMDGLKDLLPPMSDILNKDPNQPDLMQKPVGEIADPFTLNLLTSIMNYIQSKPPGTVNLDDPIDITSDGKAL